jgi:phosphopantothenoylcysteine decarboxylase / phosphopantothenate---cysteine ligase
MRILITAGPTREYLDDVRFLSNASSGRMGYALGRAAIAAGHEVVLVSGQVGFETSREMYEACVRLFPACDGAIGAAAVCDYRPRERVGGKMAKTGGALSLELVETADILAELGRRKEHRWLVGFALESQHGRENALRKLKAKNCDAIVLNHPAVIGSEATSVELIVADGSTAAEWEGEKTEIAKQLIAWIEVQFKPSTAAH